jgi:phosphatidylinositol alpha 1,6-mannosyltransferase
VIAPRSGGPIDLVDHGVNGFLFEPTDDTGLRSFVELLSTDRSARLRMGEAGRRSVIGRSWHSVCAELVGHYEAALVSAGKTVLKSS